MGLTATGYKIHNDKVTLDSVYINVRDLSTNKETIPDITTSISNYVFSCTCHVTLEDTKVDVIRIHIRQDSPIVENLWDKAYILLKEKLTEKSIAFTDSI